MKRLILTAALLLLSAEAASAQATASRSWTFGGTAGYGRTWDDEGQIGSGVLAGAYGDRRIFKRTDLELSVDFSALMTLCDRLEAAQSERERRRDRLASASLSPL